MLSCLALSACSAPATQVNADRAADVQAAVPAWVYPLNPPVAGGPAAVETAKPIQMPGSSAAFTRAQLSDRFTAPDWHPASHDPMPQIVARGRAPQVYACGYCHMPGGEGRPENAPLAGLPSPYIVQQVMDFKSGARRPAMPGHFLPDDFMVDLAGKVTAGELESAAQYFSQQALRPRVVVTERARVPRMQVVGWVYVAEPGGAEELLGKRLIEVAPDAARHEDRDDEMKYIAYVPPGSIGRGRKLAHSGGRGVTVACVTCHGAKLQGVGVIPALAGRSPTYLLRQLLAFQTRTRATTAGLPMQPVVARLSVENMIDVVAYAASLPPK